MPISQETQKALDLLAEIKTQLSHEKLGHKSLEPHVKQLENLLENSTFQRNLTIQKSLRELKTNFKRQASKSDPNNPEFRKFGTDLNKNEFDFDLDGNLIFNSSILDTLRKQIWDQEYAKRVEAIEQSIGVELIRKAAGRNIRFLALELSGDSPNSLGWSFVDTPNRTVIVKTDPSGIKPRFGDFNPGDEILAVDQRLLSAENWTSPDVLNYVELKRRSSDLETKPISDKPEEKDFLLRNDGQRDNWENTVIVTVVRNFLVRTHEGGEGDMVLTGDWTQVQVIEIANDGTGLGFGIVGGRSTGVVVKTVLSGGPADRDGRLRSGDHLLQIGTVSLHGMSSQQVAMILRQQDSQVVKLVVGRPTEVKGQPGIPEEHEVEKGDDRGSFTVATKLAVDPHALDDQLKSQTSEKTTIALHSEPEASTGLKEHSGEPENRDSTVELDENMELVVDESLEVDLDHLTARTFFRENWSPNQVEIFDLVLERDPMSGLGITVAGYVHMKVFPYCSKVRSVHTPRNKRTVKK